MPKKKKSSEKQKEQPSSSQFEPKMSAQGDKKKKKSVTQPDIGEGMSALHLSTTDVASSEEHVLHKPSSKSHGDVSALSAQPQQQSRSYAPSMQQQQPRQQQQGQSYATSMQQQQPRQQQQSQSYPSSMQQQQPRQQQQGQSYATSMQQQQPRQQQQGQSYATSMQQQQPRQQQQGQSYATSMQQQQPRQQQQSQSYPSSMQQQQPFTQSQQRKPQMKPGPDQNFQRMGKAEGTIRTSEGTRRQDKSGGKIIVATNFYHLQINPKTIVYHYHVNITPEKPVRLLRNVFEEFCAEHFKNRLICFDGKTIALSNGPLDKESFSAKVTVINPENNKEKEFDVEIKKVGTVNYSDIQNYKHLSNQISFLEIIMKNYSLKNFLNCKKSFFPINRGKNLSERVHLRSGFFQSVFVGHELYLNFDVSYMPFYNDCSVKEVYENMNRCDQSMINHFFSTLAIEYEFLGDPASHRIFRTNKLVGNAIDQTFEKDGVKMSVYDYFKTQKKYNLKRPELPLLWVGPKDKAIYLPMEFCRILPNQFFRGSLTPNETSEMIKECSSGALERMKKIQDMFGKVYRESNPFMKEFGLSIAQGMLSVEGEILKPPYLKGNSDIQVRNGEWNSKEFSKPASVKKWCVLNLDKYVRDESLMNLEKEIKQKGQELGIQIGDPTTKFKKYSSETLALKKAFQELENMDIVFVVLSGKDKDAYSRVKTLCETQKCILTQCIKSETLKNMSQDARKMSGLIGNILLKVNAKLGGENHCLSSNNVPSCLQGCVMIVGADVTHPSPGSTLPSVAAVAVSYDQNAFKYNVTLRLQTKEIILNLKEIMEHHLSEFKKQRGEYPRKILFFRDGVSEGEKKKVHDEELQAVKKACLGCNNPKITFVIVSKRHHTRFFPLKREDQDGTKNCNVPIGTCVDTKIVHPQDTEFYLLSHKAVRGTARATRYFKLYDDNNITKDELKKLTYYLCHMYARCNKSVSYPSPTYYAHLGAFRGRSYLEEFKKSLNVSFDDLNKIQDKMKLEMITQKFPMFFV